MPLGNTNPHTSSQNAPQQPLHATTQRELAELLQVSTQTIAAWESSRRRPSGMAKVLLQLLTDNPALAAEMDKGQNSRNSH